MNALRALLVSTLCVGLPALAADPVPKPDPDVVMRKPFVLNLHLDKEHYYEANIGEMPYVYGGGVYLMKGDKFGISLDFSDEKSVKVAYQPEFEKSDMTFEFTQDLSAEPNGMMLLTIRNRTSKQIRMKASMTVPGQKKPADTSILPVQPGLTDFESWPHAIVKLQLHDFEVVR